MREEHLFRVNLTELGYCKEKTSKRQTNQSDTPIGKCYHYPLMFIQFQTSLAYGVVYLIESVVYNNTYCISMNYSTNVILVLFEN